jgi:hypothetical protein
LVVIKKFGMTSIVLGMRRTGNEDPHKLEAAQHDSRQHHPTDGNIEKRYIPIVFAAAWYKMANNALSRAL